jgi:DNA-binding NarL/FixJ family response regulator
MRIISIFQECKNFNLLIFHCFHLVFFLHSLKGNKRKTMNILIDCQQRLLNETVRTFIRQCRPQWKCVMASMDDDTVQYDAVICAGPNTTIFNNVTYMFDVTRHSLCTMLSCLENGVAASVSGRRINDKKEFFSEREGQVLFYLRQGASNKEIARSLGLQTATIKLHVRNICRKMGARNRTQAALIAQRSSIN